MTVFDLVLYNGEDDVLECRLWELADVVDVMVVLEGDRTFTGKPKEKKPRDRFKQWDGLIHWVDYVTPFDQNAWLVETATRNHLLEVADGLGCQADDVVTICDVDEIWSPTMVSAFAEEPCGVMMRHLAMSVLWELPLELTCVAGPRHRVGPTADQFRRNRGSHRLLVGGWHVSWMGGEEWCANKIRSFSHQELNQGNVDAAMIDCHRHGRFVHGEVYNEVQITEDWPLWIKAGKAPESWYRRRP
jgi:hypothetical protein